MPLLTTRANASAANYANSPAELDVQWVAVGANGTLVTTVYRSPSDWVTRTSSFGSTTITSVASDGAGTWVAVGDSGKLASSTDGRTWTQRTSGFGATSISWVAYGNGTWVAVGESGGISTSTNGTTWTSVSTATSGWSSSYNIGHVAYGNGLWVALNSNGTLRTATDPTAGWTSRTSQLGAGQHYAEYHPAFSIWTSGVELGTSSGSLASSTNGTTWTARSASTSHTADSRYAITSNSSKIISSGTSGTTWVMETSTNGTSWSAVTEPTTTGFVQGQIAVRGEEDDILVGYVLSVLGLVGLGLYITTDGSTFTQVTGTGDAYMSIAHRLGHPSIR